MAKRKYHEKRKAQRYQFEAPIIFEDGEGTSKDFSLSGIYFTTKRAFQKGDSFRFRIDLDHAIPGRSVPLDCEGIVLRVDEKKKHYGIAASISGVAYHH